MGKGLAANFFGEYVRDLFGLFFRTRFPNLIFGLVAFPGRLDVRTRRFAFHCETWPSSHPEASFTSFRFCISERQPKLVEMLKDVSEVLEENTRLKKKRLEREVRKSRLKTRPAARPYDVSSGARASSTSTKTSRKVPGALGKEVAKPLEPMFVDPAPRRSRQNTVSKGKGKEVSKISVEDSMDVDCSVTIDVSMSEDPLPKRVVTKSESPPSQSQSSAKMMPPPPVPPKALKQSPKPKPPPKSTPSKTSYQPPPSSPSLTQSNPLRRRTLGMTRTTTQTSAVSHSVLPPNRKPFKSPLVKQEPGSSQSGGPSRSQSKTYPVPTSSISSQPIYPTQKPAPAKPAPKPKKSDPSEVIDITDDPDTSYDFSTSSIDGEEVDRVMAEYDRA
ncbi:hypothetical protein BJ322DRAFT_591961 [Thelephora terrestris]|uniref:Uncharacterized protein n=1 Tax=Thelephora terrestris TaxID=56493 RepID=A0A9P6L9D8_9AGAM|nr:hypothetical protein BJ322DRAFT_591961 [Thelephora terrestris]